MALNSASLKAALQAAFLANLASPTAEQIAQINNMATAMSVAIKSFVQSATITYTAGLVSPTGPVSGAFGNTIT